MNLIDALQTGNSVKRPSHKQWFLRYEDGALIYEHEKGVFYPYVISDADLMADDWMSYEKAVKIELTKTAFLNLWAEAQKEAMTQNTQVIFNDWQIQAASMNKLMEKLGFED